MTQHAETRIKERFEQLGYKPKAIKECLSRIDELSSVYPKENVGFLLRKFDKNMVTDFSNGDELWLILRDGRPVTCFLRRSTQTNDQRRSLEQQLQVDYTVRLNCLDDNGWKEAPKIERSSANEIFNEMRPEDYGVPTIANISEIVRMINGRPYSVVTRAELMRDGIRRNEEIICRMSGGSYVIVENTPVFTINAPTFQEVYSHYANGDVSIEEYITER